MFLAFAIFGFMPLIAFLPPFGTGNIHGRRFYVSVVLSLFTLALLGAVKGHITGRPWFKSSLQLTTCGILSASVSFLVGTVLAAILMPAMIE